MLGILQTVGPLIGADRLADPLGEPATRPIQRVRSTAHPLSSPAGITPSHGTSRQFLSSEAPLPSATGGALAAASPAPDHGGVAAGPTP